MKEISSLNNSSSPHATLTVSGIQVLIQSRGKNYVNSLSSPQIDPGMCKMTITVGMHSLSHGEKCRNGMSKAEQEEGMVVFPVRCDPCIVEQHESKTIEIIKKTMFYYDFISCGLYHYCIILVSFMKHFVKEIVRRTCAQAAVVCYVYVSMYVCMYVYIVQEHFITMTPLIKLQLPGAEIIG